MKEFAARLRKLLFKLLNLNMTSCGEALNDIRFAGWGQNEWADNEYIRTLRRYLDAYNSGKIEDARLDEYKDYIKASLLLLI